MKQRISTKMTAADSRTYQLCASPRRRHWWGMMGPHRLWSATTREENAQNHGHLQLDGSEELKKKSQRLCIFIAHMGMQSLGEVERWDRGRAGGVSRHKLPVLVACQEMVRRLTRRELRSRRKHSRAAVGWGFRAFHSPDQIISEKMIPPTFNIHGFSLDFWPISQRLCSDCVLAVYDGQGSLKINK